MFDMKLIGKRLKAARKDMNYSQQDVADYIGKTREQISYYENGSRQISLSLLNKLSNLYGRSLNYFIDEEPTEPELQIAFRLNDISKEDLEKIEWAKNFVSNLYELRHL
jgi:transcriptional regulator with XRE-family HTH domain